jgi:hexosaminidase
MIISLHAQQINIIPKPAYTKIEKGFLTIKEPIGFIYNTAPPGNDGTIFFKNYLKKNFKISKFVDGDTHSYGLPTEIFIDYDEDYPSHESYKLDIKADNKIYITGDSVGIYYAFQTLSQLLPSSNIISKLQIPCLTIIDSPRFQYRGMHLDVSRHFFSIDYVKKYIDFIAAHKMNYFHWHLTDDQGWRIEIKKYPKLTQIGGCRNGTIIGRYPGTGNDSIKYGGYYTQEQIKEVVKYAAEKYITIIPEIEMPGHASAAIAAYPQLSCFPDENTPHPPKTIWSGDTVGKHVQQTWGVFDDVFAPTDFTFNFLQDVLAEVMQLFPSNYIHIGGDECPKTNWKRSAFCQQLMKENNLKDEHALQSYFIQRIEKYVNSKGKKIIGWDEILEGGLAPNATVMSWRGEAGGIAAAKLNHDVIMTPGTYCYFDHSQTRNEDSVTIGGYLPIETVYSYDPIPKELNAEQAKHILGAQANVWTEYIGNEKKLEYTIFPRIEALSEVLWTPKEQKDSADFERRLQVQFKKYDKEGINYSNAVFFPIVKIQETIDNNGILFSVISKHKRSPSYFGNSSFYFGNITKSQFQFYNDSVINIKLDKSGIYGLRQLNKMTQGEIGEKWGVAYLSPFSYLYKENFAISFNKATGKKINLVNQPSLQYPGNGGAFGLVNGVRSEKGFSSTEWLGFNGKDLDATIDLIKIDTIKQVVLDVWKQEPSWIYLPNSVEVFISTDGTNWNKIATANPENGVWKDERKISINFSPVQTRFVRIVAHNLGKIPSGKAGAGNNAWLMIDEIEVN